MAVLIITLWVSLIVFGAIAMNYFIRYNKCKKELHRSRSYLSDEKLKVIEAFSHEGIKYFMYEDSLHTPTGRALYALTVYEELNMRCDREYLHAHVRANEIIHNSNPIKLTVLAQLNHNLKERLDMALLPDYVYKLAAATFFDETESPYSVNIEYLNKKIKHWKDTGVTLDFFLNTPLKDLMPPLQSVGGNVETYFQVAEMINDLHHTDLQVQLSKVR